MRQERVELADGDFVDLVWSGPEDGPIVVILHGLEGSVESPYARALMLELGSAGYTPVLMHFRGCAGEPNRLERSYHSGDTGDVAEVVDHIAASRGRHPLAIVGYSVGGNVTLKWLGELGRTSRFQAAAAVSVPFDLAACADFLNQGFARIYQRRLVKSMQQKYRTRFAGRASPLAIEDISKLDTFWRFDDAVTAPLHGFRDVHHYYADSSCGQYLRDVQTPCLIVHARNDPFVPEHAIPKQSELSDTIEFKLLEHGGHVGFVGSGGALRVAYWLERELRQFIDQFLP